MAYVRQRGKQLAIVRGQRNPETHRVEQEILFTIYSRAEALELLGRGTKGGRERFEALMKGHYPGLAFDWKKIRSGVAENLEVLPETHETTAQRLSDRFRSDLSRFTRQLALADPQWLMSAARLVKGHRRELVFLGELIDWRIRTCEREENEWNRDDPFHWRFTLAGNEVPPDVEEMASGHYEKGRLDEAEAAFRLLIDCFEDYAEGHNYLGLIALDRGNLDAAIEEFQRTVEVGRRKFPRRIGKKQYWRSLRTRPYMRGLGNLCLTFNRAGRYREALEICDRLEGECDDRITAQAHRSSIYLNTGRWEEALAASAYLQEIHPNEGFTAAFAAMELGRTDEATWRFLHAALSYPRAAHTILGLGTPSLSSRSHDDVRDHNMGVACVENLHGFLDAQRPVSRRFFRTLLRRPEVQSLLEEKAAVVERWKGPHEPEEEWRRAFDRMEEMKTSAFARRQAAALARSARSAAGSTGSEAPRGRRWNGTEAGDEPAGT